MVRNIWLAVAMAAPFGLEGCAAQGATVLHASAYCVDGKGRAARWLAGPAEFAEVWRANSQRLPVAAPPAFDFDRQAVLFVAEAEKPTGGYGLELAVPGFSIADRVASLVVRTSVPTGMVAQVFTRPCLFLGLPEGAYDSIEIKDQSGAVWGVARRPPRRAD
jgi:hypothetical protein